VRLVSSARQKQRNEKEHTGVHHGETSRRKDVYQRLSSGVVISTRENITKDMMTLKYLASWLSRPSQQWALVVVQSLSLFAVTIAPSKCGKTTQTPS
jgi:hypothetical protein